MSVRAIAAAAFALCVTALSYVFMTARDPASRVGQPRAFQPMPAMTAMPSPRSGALPAPSFDIRPETAAWSPHDSPAIVAQRWHEARNKREFFERALATGGGAYLHFAGKAL